MLAILLLPASMAYTGITWDFSTGQITLNKSIVTGTYLSCYDILNSTNGTTSDFCTGGGGGGGNFSSWIIGNGSTTDTITDGETVRILGGSGVTVSQSGSNLTITSIAGGTDTNNYTTAISFIGNQLILSRLGMTDLTASLSDNSIKLDFANITNVPAFGYGNVTANGAANYVARFTNSTNIGTGSIQDTGSQLNSTSSIGFSANKQIVLTADTPTGGISKLIKFVMNTTYDRPWIAWYDENARLRAATGYHTTDYNSSSVHAAYEIKTSSDPLGTNPTDMITRLSIGTDDNLTEVIFNAIDTFNVRNDESRVFQINASQGDIIVGNGSNVAVDIAVAGRSKFGYDGANAFVRGESTKGIVFETNGGSERLRITSAGLVGINTTSPSSTLDVYGNASISGQLCLSGDCRSSWPTGAGNVTSTANGTAGFLASWTNSTNIDTSLLFVNSSHIIWNGGTIITRNSTSNNFHGLSGGVGLELE